MTHKQLEEVVFVPMKTKIEKMTYASYLEDYGQDLTTTPHGIGERLYVKESTGEWEELSERYQIWSWGTNGNNPHFTGIDFENLDEAEMYLYEAAEWYIRERNHNAPPYYFKYEEALQDMADTYGRTPEVVARYISMITATERREAAEAAAWAAAREKEKNEISEAAKIEAAGITPDDDFRAAIQWAEQATGKEKSDRMASAMKGLLARIGKEKIESDFWQVFRILKNKS